MEAGASSSSTPSSLVLQLYFLEARVSLSVMSAFAWRTSCLTGSCAAMKELLSCESWKAACTAATTLAPPAPSRVYTPQLSYVDFLAH